MKLRVLTGSSSPVTWIKWVIICRGCKVGSIACGEPAKTGGHGRKRMALILLSPRLYTNLRLIRRCCVRICSVYVDVKQCVVFCVLFYVNLHVHTVRCMGGTLTRKPLMRNLVWKM